MEVIRRMIALNPRQTKEQSRAFVTECPLPDYDALTQSPRLKQLAERINATLDEEEQRKLKGWLPFRCPHYTRFRDNHRDREHIDAERILKPCLLVEQIGQIPDIGAALQFDDDAHALF